MKSYGDSKLFEQNSTGAWCVNSDAVKLFSVVETAVRKRGAHLPIRIYINQNIAKNNRSSGLLSVADDVPEKFYSIIRPVVDKLRLHVTSNYANVGSDYEADLLPMYTELTKACEANNKAFTDLRVLEFPKPPGRPKVQFPIREQVHAQFTQVR